MRSNEVKKGFDRAPHRSLLRATGQIQNDDDFSKPFIGIANSYIDLIPGHVHLQEFGKVAKQAIRNAGGIPFDFNTIGVDDGIAMGHPGMKSSLVSREVIADSVELTVRGHCYDAIVGVAGCDKSLPGLMMVMARLNLPSIFMYGGSILPGKFKGKQVTVQDLFEAVGEYASGKICLLYTSPSPRDS